MKRNTQWMILLISGLALLSCSAQKPPLKISVEEYKAKVYASWIGQGIGNVYGLPHENEYIDSPGPETFPFDYGDSSKRLKDANGLFSDDDTDIEYMYLLAMEKHGPEPTFDQLAQFWVHHVRERVWLANRAALAAMNYGYTPPVTGSKLYNPHWFQIDPQLINEIWAVTAPGMTRYAADKSAWAARIMTDEWGIEPTVHYAAMYSAAFFESDVHKLIEIGTAALPAGSRFAQTVEEMKVLHAKYPDDWKAARAEMAKRYYSDEPADTKTIWNANLNGAAGILALLYGGGDFQRTLDMACVIGFDADNQAATMAGLIAMIVGVDKLPKELLYPFPELGWTEPFNDLYKNVSRYDMPDVSLKELAERMAQQGEKIILANGGQRVTEDGTDYYLINPDAVFVAPMEFPAGPMPYMEIGQSVSFEFPVSGGKPPFQWAIRSGQLPEGISFKDGAISGTPAAPGVYPVTLEVSDTENSVSREFKLIVRDRNLAPTAKNVVASVKETDLGVRDKMWLSVAKSLYTPNADAIRDGKRFGTGSTFYSITADPKHLVDFYGFEWTEPQSIGLIGYHNGSMEEMGGWFETLGVETLDAAGKWKPVEGVQLTPPLASGPRPFNKPHFVEYLLAFPPVETTAVRIIGNAGGGRHWSGGEIHFTSITELTVHGALPGYESLEPSETVRTE